MARKRTPLRVVDTAEPAKPAKKAPARKAPAKKAARKVTPVSVAVAARSGDHRTLLVALGARIAKAIDDPGTQPTALAALIRQQVQIAAEIAAIDQPPAEKDSSGEWLEAIRNMPASEPWDESMI